MGKKNKKKDAREGQGLMLEKVMKIWLLLVFMIIWNTWHLPKILLASVSDPPVPLWFGLLFLWLSKSRCVPQCQSVTGWKSVWARGRTTTRMLPLASSCQWHTLILGAVLSCICLCWITLTVFNTFSQTETCHFCFFLCILYKEIQDVLRKDFRKKGREGGKTGSRVQKRLEEVQMRHKCWPFLKSSIWSRINALIDSAPLTESISPDLMTTSALLEVAQHSFWCQDEKS